MRPFYSSLSVKQSLLKQPVDRFNDEQIICSTTAGVSLQDPTEVNLTDVAATHGYKTFYKLLEVNLLSYRSITYVFSESPVLINKSRFSKVQTSTYRV